MAASGCAGQNPLVGRFAPSPTGPLHAGSLVAALASWLDARAQGGQWLLRIEDVDRTRCQVGAADWIQRQLRALGLVWDGPVWFQSQRNAAYQQALDRLVAAGRAYACGCSRSDIRKAWAAQGAAPDVAPVYPGTCRAGLITGHTGRTWRFRLPDLPRKDFISKWPLSPVPRAITTITNRASLPDAVGRMAWWDRRLGPQVQDLPSEVGDFVLRRADGFWAYQLAVVVDDAAQGVTDVVRGEDLADNTPRQMALQQALGLPALRYLHTPLVWAAPGHKLSKSDRAPPLDLDHPVQTLNAAAAVLGLPLVDEARAVDSALSHWTAAWALAHFPP